MDEPNHRSSHVMPTLRGGGTALAIGTLAALGVAQATTPTQTPFWLLTAVILGGAAALGFVEDVRGLPVAARLVGQTVLALVGALGLCAWGLADGLAPWLVPLGAVAGIFYVNAANFIDGINGISSAMGTIAGLHFSALGLLVDSQAVLVVGLILVGVFAAFWPWNAPTARIFLGDVGSYLLGAAVWFASLVAMTAGVNPIAAAAPMLISAVDVLITLLRRHRRGERLTEAHRDHIYQRLARAWGSHTRSTFFAATACGLACAGGLLMVWSGSWQSAAVRWSGIPLAVLIMIASVGLYVWGEYRTGTRTLTGGAGR